jgi:hypothetical protein
MGTVLIGLAVTVTRRKVWAPSSLLDLLFHFFARLEDHHTPCGDWHFFASPGVAADSCLALLDLKNAEVSQLNPAFPNQGRNQCVERRLDELTGFLLGEADLLCNRSYDVFLGHGPVPLGPHWKRHVYRLENIRKRPKPSAVKGLVSNTRVAYLTLLRHRDSGSTVVIVKLDSICFSGVFAATGERLGGVAVWGKVHPGVFSTLGATQNETQVV